MAPRLRLLSVSHCGVLSSLSVRCKALTELQAVNCSSLNLGAGGALFDCPRLRTLNLFGCRQLNAEGKCLGQHTVPRLQGCSGWLLLRPQPNPRPLTPNPLCALLPACRHGVCCRELPQSCAPRAVWLHLPAPPADPGCTQASPGAGQWLRRAARGQPGGAAAAGGPGQGLHPPHGAFTSCHVAACAAVWSDLCGCWANCAPRQCSPGRPLRKLSGCSNAHDTPLTAHPSFPPSLGPNASMAGLLTDWLAG